MQQEAKIIAMLMQNLDKDKIINLSKFLSSALYTDDRYCLINILLGYEHLFYNKGDIIYCAVDSWQMDKIENIDFCINHGFVKQINNVHYIRAEVTRACEYKSNIYANLLACNIDGEPIVIDTDRSVSRDRILNL